jgi:6-phosphogluconolactonase
MSFLKSEQGAQRQVLALRAFIACVLCVLPCQPIIAQTSVILSVSNEKKLVVYSLNEVGVLAIESVAMTTGKPGCSIANRSGTRLYVAMKGTNSIATFSFDHKSGLKLLGETQVVAAASYLAIDPTGDYLFSSYYKDGKIAIHRINDDGTPDAKPLDMIETDAKAHCIALDRSGTKVFVAHTGPNAIFQFDFDPKTDKLTPNTTPKLVRKEGTGPRHLWFHPENDFAYGSDEQGSSVTVYKCDPKGTLSVVQTLSTLPEGFKGKNTTSDIEIHPSNKFVFVANRGSDTIASFAIDSDSGLLSLIEHSKTVPFTRSFNISADGKHLVAAGQKSNKIRVFAIRDDGKTKLLSTADSGKAPWWVQIIQNKEDA